MYQLHIANKNYSSWSLRPWLLLKLREIPFEEVLHPFHDTDDWTQYRQLNPAGQVPCLIDAGNLVWDSLAIIEYIAERHDNVWPTDPQARSWARCAAAEMHSGFFALREQCSMNCGLRIELHEMTPALAKSLARLETLWNQGLSEFGGPYLAGNKATAVDAFYAPVVFRLQTYGLTLNGPANDYYHHMLAHPVMQSWYQAGLNEPYEDAEHDADIPKWGRVTEDLRNKP